MIGEKAIEMSLRRRIPIPEIDREVCRGRFII